MYICTYTHVYVCIYRYVYEVFKCSILILTVKHRCLAYILLCLGKLINSCWCMNGSKSMYFAQLLK